MENQTSVDELSYREASTELEHIIRNLESGDMELEASRCSWPISTETMCCSPQMQRARRTSRASCKDAPGPDTRIR